MKRSSLLLEKRKCNKNVVFMEVLQTKFFFFFLFFSTFFIFFSVFNSYLFFTSIIAIEKHLSIHNILSIFSLSYSELDFFRATNSGTGHI